MHLQEVGQSSETLVTLSAETPEDMMQLKRNPAEVPWPVRPRRSSVLPPQPPEPEVVRLPETDRKQVSIEIHFVGKGFARYIIWDELLTSDVAVW